MAETISTQVEEDSELIDEFNDYREQNSMNSKSEAVRTLMRDALQDRDDEGDSQREDTEEDETKPSLSDSQIYSMTLTFFVTVGVAGSMLESAGLIGPFSPSELFLSPARLIEVGAISVQALFLILFITGIVAAPIQMLTNQRQQA